MPRRKKRKIMSVDELYSFCLKNNFSHFSSDESGKELMVRMNGNPGMAGSNFKIEDFAVDKNAIETFSNDAFIDSGKSWAEYYQSDQYKSDYKNLNYMQNQMHVLHNLTFQKKPKILIGDAIIH